MGLDLGACSVDFLLHASTLISFGGKKIYVDPWKLPPNPPKADIVFVTHEHFDHLDVNSIKLVSTPKTIVVTNARCSAKIHGSVRVIEAGQSLEVLGVKVLGVQAYNIGKKFHPLGLVTGFVLDFAGKKIYHAGDTDFIPEMRELKGIDVALLPIGGTYTMDEKEAAEAANAFKPKIVVPMHFNVVEGTNADPQKFAMLVKPPTQVEVLYR